MATATAIPTRRLISVEADRFDDGGPELQPGQEVTGSVAPVAADDQAAGRAGRLDEEQPARSHPAILLPGWRMRQCRHLRVEAQFRALARGPLRVDCSGVADLAADVVLQPLVAVEPAAVRADLHDPRPYALGGRVDLDGVRPAPSWFRDQFVTGIPGRGRLRGRSPPAAGASAGTTGCTKHHPTPHVETRPAASQPSAPSLSGSATAPSSLVKSATACPSPASVLLSVFYPCVRAGSLASSCNWRRGSRTTTAVCMERRAA